MPRASPIGDYGREAANLFVTGLIDAFFPEVGESVVRVLRRAGVELAFPASQTHRSSTPASRDLARAQARRTLAVLKDRRVPVIVPSGSCAAGRTGTRRAGQAAGRDRSKIPGPFRALREAKRRELHRVVRRLRVFLIGGGRIGRIRN